MSDPTASFDIDAMVTQLAGEEKLAYFVYDDASGEPIRAGSQVRGNPTGGIGRNLATTGLSADEARYLCRNDIARVETELDKAYPWWRQLSPIRQMQMIDLEFNIGEGGLAQFHNFLAAMQSGNWQQAVDQLHASEWWHQVGERGPMIAARILAG
jgi:lysozyme